MFPTKEHPKYADGSLHPYLRHDTTRWGRMEPLEMDIGYLALTGHRNVISAEYPLYVYINRDPRSFANVNYLDVFEHLGVGLKLDHYCNEDCLLGTLGSQLIPDDENNMQGL